MRYACYVPHVAECGCVPTPAHRYDAKADLWSVGAIMFELLTARPPYSGANHVQLLKNIEAKEPKIPTNVSQPCRALMHTLLQRDPASRRDLAAQTRGTTQES